MIDADMMQDFHNEARENLDPVISQLQSIISSSKEERVGLINALFREIHTIKGMAGFLDLNNFTTLAHTMETLMDCGRKDVDFFTEPMITALVEAADLLDEMLENLADSESVSIDHLIDRLSQFCTHQGSEVFTKPEQSVIEDSQKQILSNWDLAKVNFQELPSDYENYYLLDIDLYKEEINGRSPLTVYRELKQTGEILLSRSLLDNLVYTVEARNYPIQILYASRLDENTIF